MKILLTVAFDGTAFCGWQFQPGVRTVQKVLTDACRTVFGSPCSVTGCSRTDSGVHALGFRCTVEPAGEKCPPCGRLPLAFSAVLPPDLAVLDAAEIPRDFHARYSVREKEYEYRIYLSRIPDPFTVHREYRFPAPLLPDWQERMQRAADLLTGTHDFTSFMASGSKITDAVRTVRFCRVTAEGDRVRINIAADGFLYNMVRIIVGTLLEVGRGSREPEELSAILAARDRTRAGVTAPAHGLYLKRVSYGNEKTGTTADRAPVPDNGAV